MRLVYLDDPIEFLPRWQRRIVRRHQTSTYVELGPLFEELGVAYEMRAMPDSFSGTSFHSSGSSPTGFIVRVNQRHGMERRRFTAAHELGHCLLHGEYIKMKEEEDTLFSALNRDLDPQYCPLLGDYILDPLEDRLTHRQEIEANQFAAALLMPARILNKLWRAGIREPEGLARQLGVSLPALKRRMRELK